MLTTEAIQSKYDSLPPDEQQKFKRQVIYKIVDTNYGDRITAFNIDDSPKDNSIASGNFSTPKLGGKNLIVDWVIKADAVVLTPQNLEVINHGESQYHAASLLTFSFAQKIKHIPLEFYNFARTLKCDKGWACGGACLSKEKKNCHRSLTPEHKTYVGWLQTQIDKDVALHKGHREEAAKLGLKKKTGGEVPDTVISDRSTKRVAIKRLSGVPKPDEHTEKLAKSVLATGVQSPVITLRNEKGGYDVVAGGKMAAALVKAKDLDPKKGELQHVFVADTKDQANALKYQMKFIKEPSPDSKPVVISPREITHGSTEKLGQSSLVSVKRISGNSKRYNPDDIENLAQSQLKVGNIVPVVVHKTAEGEYELVHGGLALAAARRAKEIDPKGGEKLRVFIANNKNEADALGYQIGGKD
ncbi:MAG: ParB N-terminal domain-containing protein [Rhizonema sp. NSF051]|nr:ParB N-terminal domain-containing protein [Rhizonema sp. NSF051]